MVCEFGKFTRTKRAGWEKSQVVETIEITWPTWFDSRRSHPYRYTLPCLLNLRCLRG